MPELDRRDFLKLVGASAGAAAAAGCSDPVEKLVPYVIQAEEILPGTSTEYASTCRECAAGCGLYVTTRDGRPIKLEGHPDNPIKLTNKNPWKKNPLVKKQPKKRCSRKIEIS
jgi:anaerobic selenocysteine-containing dehydrogenase